MYIYIYIKYPSNQNDLIIMFVIIFKHHFIDKLVSGSLDSLFLKILL